MNNKVVFFAPMCLLDNTSGAAISARTFLEVLAEAGFACFSFTAALFDPNREMDRTGILGARARDPQALGKRFIIERQGVTHSIFLTRHSQSKNMLREEQSRFEASWMTWLDQNEPGIVLTFGGSPYTSRLQQHARERGIRIVHYLGNAEYNRTDFYKTGDTVICPSRFLKDHYRETLGIETEVLRNIIKADRLDLVTHKSREALLHRMGTGFVTYMNPIPHKGLTLFFELAKMAAKHRPRLKFLVTEGRTSREWLAKRGYDLSTMDNIWFMCNHEDVRSIYEKTSILLIPSFWKEGLGRSILEAQLSGIPVLGTRQGGIPEALNGGGTLFEVPAQCLENFLHTPEQDYVERWLAEIEQLLDNDQSYLDASDRAVEASREFHPATTSRNAVQFFSRLLTQ